MNNQGLVFFYTFMIGTLVIVFALGTAGFVKELIDGQRTKLGCSAPDTDWIEAECLFLDLTKPLITGGLILIGVAIIGARMWIGT